MAFSAKRIPILLVQWGSITVHAILNTSRFPMVTRFRYHTNRSRLRPFEVQPGLRNVEKACRISGCTSNGLSRRLLERIKKRHGHLTRRHGVVVSANLVKSVIWINSDPGKKNSPKKLGLWANVYPWKFKTSSSNYMVEQKLFLISTILHMSSPWKMGSLWKTSFSPFTMNIVQWNRG